MITPIYSAYRVTSENIKFFNDFDYAPHDFVELNKSEIAIGKIVVTATINFKDPIDETFGIRRQSHWIVSEELFNKKFDVTQQEDTFMIINPK
jgi:hypothetical protein